MTLRQQHSFPFAVNAGKARNVSFQTDIERSIYLLELSPLKTSWHPLNRHNIPPAFGAFGSQGHSLQTKGFEDGWMKRKERMRSF